MNKLYFLLLIFLTWYSVDITAQYDPAIEKTFGIEPFVGLQTVGIIDDGKFLPDESFGDLSIGVLGDYRMTKNWGFQTGLIKSTAGFRAPFTITDQNGNPIETELFNFKNPHLTIPFNASWFFGKNRRWNLDFGLAYSFSIGDFNQDSPFFGLQNFDNFAATSFAISYGIPIGNGTLQLRSLGYNSTNNVIGDFSQSLAATTVGYKMRL